jgi:tetratricopeptide (TPR) repeat protein
MRAMVDSLGIAMKKSFQASAGLLRGMGSSKAITLTALSLVSSISLGANAIPERLIRIEAGIWTGEDNSLLDHEKQVVREIQQNPNSAFAHYLLSHLSIRMLATNPSDSTYLERATMAAQQAAELDPKSEFGYAALAELLDLTGHTDKALNLLKEAAKGAPAGSWRLKFLRAWLSEDEVNAEDASDMFRDALMMPNANRDVIVPFVVAAIHSDDIQADIRKLEAWSKDFPHSYFTKALAIRYLDAEQYEMAHSLYQKVIALDPSDHETLVNDAILLYRYLKKSKEALREFDVAASSGLDSLSDSARGAYFAHRATLLTLMNRPGDAKQDFLLALRATENSESMIRLLGGLFQEYDHTKELANLLGTASDEVPGSPFLHAYLGEIYSEKLNNQDQALQYFANAITLDPSQSHYYNLMGLAYYKMSSFEDARKLFSAAFQVDPFDATAKYNEACALARVGQGEQAMDSLETALEIDPSLHKTALADSDFEGIAGSQRFKQILQGAKSEQQLAH